MVHRAGEVGLSVLMIFFACCWYSCSMLSVVATSTMPSTTRATSVPNEFDDILTREGEHRRRTEDR